MVVTILGLVAGTALTVLGPRLEQARSETTRDRQDILFEALQAFVFANGRLPCPADGRLSQGAAAYGEEQPAGGGECALDPSVAVVPWVSLAVPESASFDGWGRRFAYVAADTPTTAELTTQGDAGFRIDEGNLLVAADSADVAGTLLTDVAAFVLLSHGANGDGGYLASGSRFAAAPSGPDETENQDSDLIFIEHGLGSSEAGYYDDVLLWRTKAGLRFAAGGVFNAAQCTSAANLASACDCEGTPGCLLGSLTETDVCPAAIAVLDFCGP